MQIPSFIHLELLKCGNGCNFLGGRKVLLIGGTAPIRLAILFLSNLIIFGCEKEIFLRHFSELAFLMLNVIVL